MSTYRVYQGAKEVLNSNAHYSLQHPYRFQDVQHGSFLERGAKRHHNVREDIPQSVGPIARSNWAYGAGYGWHRTLGFAAPAAHQLPFNPRTRIPYWDKHVPYTPMSNYRDQSSPFLLDKGQR